MKKKNIQEIARESITTKSVLSLLLAIVITIVMLEVIMTIFFGLTENTAFQTIKHSKYPSNPDGYLKVAIFGASEALGYGADITFYDVIKYELKNLNSKVYVSNFAIAGNPFHKYQAEILKSLIDEYDIFLVYAGNNEIHNYLDDSGFFRKKEYRDQKSLEFSHPIDDDDNQEEKNVFSFLERRSRLYSLSKKSFDILYSKIKNIIGKSENQDIYRELTSFKEFQSKGIIPLEEIESLKTNFEKDLHEIGKLAKENNKHIVIANIPKNKYFKPSFSVAPNDESWWEGYRRGLESYEKKDYERALTHFLDAHKINSSAAILEYLIGDVLTKLGRIKESFDYFEKSIDNDGYPLRAFSELGLIAKEVTSQYENFHFIDIEEEFSNMIANGSEYTDIFADLVHLTETGHIVTAYMYLDEIQGIIGKKKQFQIEQDKLEVLRKEYLEKLRVTKQTRKESLLYSINWLVSASKLTAYPEQFFDIAEIKANNYFELTDKNEFDRSEFLLIKALIKAGKGEKEDAVNLANQASEEHIQSILDNQYANKEKLLNSLANLGIIYEQKKFKQNSSLDNR